MGGYRRYAQQTNSWLFRYRPGYRLGNRERRNPGTSAAVASFEQLPAQREARFGRDISQQIPPRFTSIVAVYCPLIDIKEQRVGSAEYIYAGIAMQRREFCSARLMCGAVIALSICGVALSHAADIAPAPKNWQLPRTETGDPDLQGVWTSATLTRFDRPDEFGDRLILTPQEARKIEGTEEQFVANAAKPSDPKKKEVAGVCTNFQFGCGYNNFWIDRGSQVIRIDGQPRSSILIDPPNGKLPPLTAARRTQLAEHRKTHVRYDGPETLALAERCLLSFGSSSGPPMLPVLYNNHYQIVQTKDTVTILIEMVHDARIVRMNDQHVPSSVRKWMGDSIGHWDGNTLVVETTNFTTQEGFRGSTENAKVTERFTRVGPSTINYKFTVDDPAAFTRSFSGEIPFNKTADHIYEYGCHEGNYALPGILAGARAQEKNGKSAADATTSSAPE